MAEVEQMKAKGVPPKLAVVLVGDDEASVVYARSKEKVRDKLGIIVELTVKPSTTSEADVLSLIDKLNADESVHGILVELPLPKGISKEKVMSRLDPLKDVDGVHPVTRGYLLGGQDHLALVPAPPMACIELMERAEWSCGQTRALVGRGDPGAPCYPCSSSGPTITVCHTKTVDIPSITKAAEVVSCRRQGRTVTGDICPRQIVVAPASTPRKKRITGDVDSTRPWKWSRPFPRFRRRGLPDHTIILTTCSSVQTAWQALITEFPHMTEVYT